VIAVTSCGISTDDRSRLSLKLELPSLYDTLTVLWPLTFIYYLDLQSQPWAWWSIHATLSLSRRTGRWRPLFPRSWFSVPATTLPIEWWCQNTEKSKTRCTYYGFLPRDSYAKLCICHRRVSVCLCVCLSVTLRYCIKTAKRRITQITPHDSPGTLVFWHQSSRQNSNGITPYGGDRCTWGGLKFVTFDEKCTITRKRYKIDA